MSDSGAIPQDPVAAAIAGPAQKRVNAEIKLATSGRVVVMNLPADVSDGELVDLVGEIATNLRRQVRASGSPRPRLLVPR